MILGQRRLFLVGLFVMFSWVVNSQEKIPVMRYVYQANFPLPSNDSVSLKMGSELVYLDLKDGQSRFVSSGGVFKEETTLDYNTGSRQEASNSELIAALSSGGTALKIAVYRNQDQLNSYENSGMDFYNVTEPVDLILWQVQPGFEQYHGMQVQKAIGNYANRTWQVWFTQDIALNEGPYKFKNLPGFVVKAIDDTGQWSFELLEVKADTTTYWTPLRAPGAMVVDKGQYLKIKKNNANKTVGQFLQEKGPDNKVRIFNSSGKEATDSFLKHKTKVNVYRIELD